MNTPTYTVVSTNFDFHAPVSCKSFREAVEVATKRGWEASITDGMGEAIASWSPVFGLRMLPNKYSK